MIKEFWREGLFGELDERYFRLIDRSSDMNNEVNWDGLIGVRFLSTFKRSLTTHEM